MPSIVALDLETTGLDSRKDTIIEIGAVRFNNRRIEDEWSTLVNPQRQIPPFITKLTGISDAMVRNSPTIHEVLPDLEHFVEDLPILGHNVKFDLSFLHAQNVFKFNDSLDTYDMASVLVPNAGRYNLGALGQLLNIPHPATHRALDDARVTHGVYTRLFEKAMNMPIDVLADITRMGETVDWGGGWVFKEAMKQRSRQPIQARRSMGLRDTVSGPLFTNPAPKRGQALEAFEEEDRGIPLDDEEAASYLEHGGQFAKHFPHFEYRPQQVEMLRAVSQALSDGRHLLAEAGTGTGKSMAYLVPSALWALQNNTRVVVSTNTINLQDQLINKDIPDLQAVISPDLKAAVLKGRGNYLCPRRLEAMRRKGPENGDEMRLLAKMLIWLEETERGDVNEINLTGPKERAIWSRINADDEGCSNDTCVRRMSGICPLHRARQAAQEAHVLVVNHALLLADVATGNRILPDYKHVIVDEAHHIEAATTSALSFRVTQPEVERMLRELGGTNAGLLGRTLVVAQEWLEPGQIAALQQLVDGVTDKAFQFQNLLKRFFISLDGFLSEQREGRKLGSYPHQERILPNTRMLAHWMEVETAWEEGGLAMKALLNTLEQIGQALVDLSESGDEEVEDLLMNVANLHRRLGEVYDNIDALVFNPSEMQIYWAAIEPQRRRITLHAAPLHIGSLMEDYLWMQKTTVVLTSATLTTAGEFGYIRERLNAFDAEELALGSPFDYPQSTLLFMPDNIPEPSDRNGHQRMVNNTLVKLAKATGGRALALFTSYAQLKQTSNAIRGQLEEVGIQVYEQGEGASPHSLLESFKEAEQAVLLGTRAFWEGVDIPGESLSVLAIVKLPFAVPSDPIVAARSETFEQPFFQYQIPEAILTFRQGFGRLIRTAYDRGVVAILDKRLLSKSYGKLFIDSLPECEVVVGPVQDLPDVASHWLG